MLFIRKVSFLFQKRRQTTRAYLFADFFDARPSVGKFFAPNEAPGLPTEAQTLQQKPRHSNRSPDTPTEAQTLQRKPRHSNGSPDTPTEAQTLQRKPRRSNGSPDTPT